MQTYLKYNMNGASSWIFNINVSLFWNILLNWHGVVYLSDYPNGETEISNNFVNPSFITHDCVAYPR